MKSIKGWKYIFVISLIIVSTFFFVCQTQALVLVYSPKIVDVTTRSFSVVWISQSPYSSCSIQLYSNSSYTQSVYLDPNNVMIETEPGRPGSAGKQYGLGKITVSGLGINTTYYPKVTIDGTPYIPSPSSVTTGNLRGLTSDDPNQTDIVSNDIVHKAVYRDVGISSTLTTPALGALVMAEILNPDNPADVLSDFPISAWVGDRMIGDPSKTSYDPNNISYQQYASLEMSNLFGKDKFPLSLHGYDPNSNPIKKAEIIRFTILYGTQPVLGKDPATSHYFINYGRVDTVETIKTTGEKITTPKVSASFKFKKGMNNFALPFNVIKDGGAEYTSVDLFNAIEQAGGQVKAVYVREGSEWKTTIRQCHPIFGCSIGPSKPISLGTGCYIFMKEAMNNEFIFYGKPDPAKVNLTAGLNLISFPQLPVYYTTYNLLKDIEAAGAGEYKVLVYFYDDNGEWRTTSKSSHPIFGVQPSNEAKMLNTQFYYVFLKPSAGVVGAGFDPFAAY